MTAEWDDLARLAEAATRGPWGLYSRDFREHRSHSVKSSAGSVVAFAGHGPGGGTAQANAEFIAAANPATILRLVEDLRESQMERADLLIERDALAARLAAVEAEAAAHDRGRGECACALCAVLSAAPTDTTKEN